MNSYLLFRYPRAEQSTHTYVYGFILVKIYVFGIFWKEHSVFFIESHYTMKKILNVHIYEVCKLIIDNIVNRNITDSLEYTFRAKTLLFNVKHFLVFLFNWYQLPPKFDLLSVFNKFFDHWDLTIFFLSFFR